MHLRQPISCALALLAPLALSTSALADYVAYDDTSAGSTITATAAGANVTNITPTDTTTGSLVDYTTGASFATLTFSVTSGTVTALNNGTANPPSGSDAYDIFNGFVDLRGTYSGSGTRVIELTFSDLDPAKRYEVAFYAQRNTASVQGNTFTISDADAFTNAGTDVGDPNSDSYFVVYSNPDGDVAQWINVAPGADGDFVVSVAGGTSGVHLSGLRFIERDVPEPASIGLLGLGLFTMFRRKR